MTEPLFVRVDDLCVLSEIADFLGVGPSAVSNWKKRHDDFPKPVVMLGKTEVYLKSEIIQWYRQHLSPERLAALKEIVSEL